MTGFHSFSSAKHYKKGRGLLLLNYSHLLLIKLYAESELWLLCLFLLH